MTDLLNPIFQDADKAREWLEARIWANGRFCPHCGAVDQSTLLQRGTKPRKDQPEKKRPARNGLYQCNICREPFTVTVGTLYERSHIPLNKWLAATHLMMASKKGMSAMQVHRMLGVSYKSAWFMCHRIRESLRDTKLAKPLGGTNQVVEADETYIGGKEANKHKSKRQKGMQGGKGKEPVVSLVERGGRIRSQHMPEVIRKMLMEMKFGGPTTYSASEVATRAQASALNFIAKNPTHSPQPSSGIYGGFGNGYQETDP